MKRKGTVILSLLCGVVCAAAVLVYMQEVQSNAAAARNEALARYGGDQIEVCVATRTIAAGEVVDAANTTTRMWLVDLLPEGSITSLANVAGKQTNSTIVVGEVLCEARFESQESSVSVPAGLQAVGVELGAAQAIGGALLAGSVVDVYAAGQSGTTLIAEHVLVAAVAEASSGRLSVTLAVDPQHVEEVIAATQTASLYLTLPAKTEGENHV